MIYCPYTNKDINKNQTSPEHIIPLSLGGINGFEIPVCKEFNTRIGSTIDGAVANDFFVIMKRNKYDVRGHSKKRPVLIAKKSKDQNTQKPVQVAFDRKEGLKIWSPIEKSYIQGQGDSFKCKLTVDDRIDLKFVAKVSLAAGYFAYGNLFREHVKHSEPRLIMNNNPDELGDKIRKIKTTVDKRFSNDQNEQLKIFRTLCKAVGGCSIVGLVPSMNSLTVFVGILGDYMGMVNIPAQTDHFPNEGAYRLGHIICPQDGKLVRISFYQALKKLVNTNTKNHEKTDPQAS